ncbi:inositol monophosphatase family protein [Kiloniella antarctica]|uniref:Inositol monophosphatase family protein n=1 Tax=Kiloniella antarctica TaxID=1550907 RepID=A0ABW5BN93_9PROT
MFSKLDKVEGLLKEVSDLEIVPRFRNLKKGDISFKDGGETVTVADIETEKRLSKLIIDLFPGSYVIGEESFALEPDLLRTINPDHMTWIIDPVDGTNNFAKGVSVFKCMLALVYQGETVAGWIYDPIDQTTLQARAGEGAYLDNKRLSISIPTECKSPECIGTLHTSKDGHSEVVSRIEKNRSKLNVVKTLRCAGADYERLATSKTQFSLYTRLMPWDHLPGVLIHNESGGYSACLDKELYKLDSYTKSGLLLAPNKKIWAEINSVLFSEI